LSKYFLSIAGLVTLYLVYGNGSDKNKGNLIYTATGMPENNLLVPMLSNFQVCRPGEIGFAPVK